MKRFAAFVSIIVGLNACGSLNVQKRYTQTPVARDVTERHIHVYIDKGFSARQISAISRALIQWNIVFNHQIILDIISYDFDMEPQVLAEGLASGSYFVLKVPESAAAKKDEPCIPGTICDVTLAWVDKIGGNFVNVCVVRIDDTRLEEVALHEIGHLFKLRHTGDKQSLMYNHISESYSCIDKKSAIRAAENMFLDPNLVNYCQ